MRNGYVRFGQFLTFFAGVVCGNADFVGDQKWYVATALFAIALVLDFVGMSHIDKGVREEVAKAKALAESYK